MAYALDEAVREAAIARLHELFISDEMSLEALTGHLHAVMTAATDAELRTPMAGLPPPVRLTPPQHRRATPLLLHEPAGDIELRAGWQLARDTTLRIGSRAATLDLSIASWDAPQVDLRIETWGLLDVLIPAGVAVLIGGGIGRIEVRKLTAPLPGGPQVRVSSIGPGGLVRVQCAAANRRSADRVGLVNAVRRAAGW